MENFCIYDEIYDMLITVDSIGKLWIDAIFINHEGLFEHVEQVSIMSTIYGQAFQVLIWLGSPIMGEMKS